MTDIRDLGILAIGTRLRVASENLGALVKDFYSAHGLDFEPRWFPVFQLVRRQPGISLVTVAGQIGVSHTAVKVLVKPMLEAGLLTADINPDDARAKQLRLTQAGEVLYARLQPAWFALEKAEQEAFGKDADTILRALETLEDAITDRAIPRALRNTLSAESVAAGLKLVSYDAANPDHARMFAALNIEWLQTYHTVEPVDYRMFADPVATIIAPGGEIVLAEVSGQIVGTGAIIKRSETIYELAKMAVSRTFQARGIGAAIVRHFEDRARQRGLEKLYLVSSVRLPHAVRMYRKLGWTDCPLRLHDVYERADISLEKVL